VRIVQLLAAANLIVLAATTAHARQTGVIYVQADVGGDYYGANELDGQGFDIDTGLWLGARIGKMFSFFRGEVEGGLAVSTIDLEADAGDEDANYYQLSILAGAYKDIGPVYIGGGAGLVYQEIETEILGANISNGETNFSVHGEACISFNVTENVQLVPHYRATWLPGFNLDDEVIVHSARLGVRFGIAPTP